MRLPNRINEARPISTIEALRPMIVAEREKPDEIDMPLVRLLRTVGRVSILTAQRRKEKIIEAYKMRKSRERRILNERMEE